jgi:hypothetical protein
MKLYDEYGREVYAESMDFTVSDTRYIRKDTSDTFTGDLTCIFAGSNARIKNGKIQIKDDNDGLWYNLGLQSPEGIRSFYPANAGEI